MLGNKASDTQNERNATNKEMSKDVGKPKQRAIPLRNYLTNEVFYDTLYTEADRVITWMISILLKFLAIIKI